jgi:hypothetical protein
MKRLTFILIIALFAGYTAWAQQQSITFTWKGSLTAKTVEIQASAGTDNITVNWGNGTDTAQKYSGNGGYLTLTSPAYADTNSYMVSIKANIGTNLTYLDVYNKQLSVLDVSNNTALTTLFCSSNQLTVLDVSTNTALNTLWCHSNQLSTLNVNGATALTQLLCNSNQLTTLDVSNNTALIELSCNFNQLSTLNVNGATALTYLSCHSNQLTALDVSNNTALIELSCNFNQLTALDVNNNTALTYLSCNSNQLTALNVNNNTALTDLYCYSNQLTALDVKNNTALTELHCSYNQLTTLDVNNNTALIYLNCRYNQLPLSQLYPIWKNKGITSYKYLIPQYIYDTLRINTAKDLSAELEFGNPAAQTKFTIVMQDNSSTTGKYTFINGILNFTEAGDYEVTMRNDSVREGTSTTGDPLFVITYYHVLFNNANLISLAVSEGELSPVFDTDILEYTISEPFCTGTEITFTVIAEDSSAAIEGAIANYILSVSDTAFIITVTAEDGITEKEYKINIMVNSVYETAVEASIVQGESYDFFGTTLTTAGEYTHTLQSIHGCDSVIVLTLTVTVSITDLQQQSISIYPNPTSGKLTIHNEQLIIEHITIYDISGKLLETLKGSETFKVLDVSNLANGIYLVKVKTENGETVRKIVKQ